MKSFKLVFLLVILLAFADSAYTQSGFSGTVVEVIDGKTVVVELHTKSRITAQLQFIEVPEPEQQLHKLVIEHLKGLVLGKYVSFKPRGIVQDKSTVQLFADGIDISQQMIRDGAAWHAVLEKSGQDADERAIYENTEKQAKAEKRGVWSKEGMLPAWEFRIALEEKKKLEERAKLDEIKVKEEVKKVQSEIIEERKLSNNNANIWVDVYGYDFLTKKIPENLKIDTSPKVLRNALPIRGYDESINKGYVATHLSGMTLMFKGEEFEVLAVMINFFEVKDEEIENNRYVIRFYSESDKEIFPSKQKLVLTLPKRKAVLIQKEKSVEKYKGKIREMIEFDVPEELINIMRSNAIYEINLGKYEKFGDTMFEARVISLLAGQSL